MKLWEIIWAAILTTALIVLIATATHKPKEDIRQIYAKLWAQTGQIKDKLPLVIEKNNQENAYNDGTKIVIFTGMIDTAKSDDEIALILGHEIAHGNLWHLKMGLKILTDEQLSELEANADKMGAVYMMKAGYDVCAGREMFKRWQKQGDYVSADHPNHAYRYAELNINCGE